MPWRKYPSKDGKYGKAYIVTSGVTVRKDKRGIWTVFINHCGQRQNKSVGRGKEGREKAIRKAEQVIAALKKNPDAMLHEPKPESGVPFEEYARDSLELQRAKNSESTYVKYEGLLRKHIAPYFKGKTLAEITRADVKKFSLGLLKKRSASVVETALIVIKVVFDDAVDENLVSANPASDLRKKVLPPVKQRMKSEADPFTLEERDVFLNTAEEICTWSELLVFKTMFFCGLRLGETLAMKPNFLNPQIRTYFVRQSYKGHKFGKPKKGKVREVDVPDFLLEELLRYRTWLEKESLKKGDGGKVKLFFQDPKEQGAWPFSQRKIQSLMKRVNKKAGLRHRHPHDLRHTYASIMLMAHQSPAYLQRQLGHSSIKTTVDVYGHWIPGEGRRNLEEALHPGSGNPKSDGKKVGHEGDREAVLRK